MRLYLEVARLSFRRHLAYRAATLAGLFTNAVFGVMIATVFRALYDGGNDSTVAGFSLPEALTFVWAAQSLIMVVYLWGWWEVAAAVKTGDIVVDLMKPYAFQGYWLGRDLGRAACHALTRLLPTLLFGVLLYDLALPRSAGTWFAAGLSVLLAVVVSFGWRFLLNLSAFWLLDARGVNMMAMVVVNFFSGLLVPLAFFPDWLRTVANLLPFRAFVMVPIEVLLGQRGLGSALVIQVFWAVALALLAQAVLALAVRKVVIQGG
ncbi:MAG: ABC-2 family transporter protein [Chloroflexota bacterium]|nr:ABC-2 family transporter protein [Chloroflexota bacterium]